MLARTVGLEVTCAYCQELSLEKAVSLAPGVLLRRTFLTSLSSRVILLNSFAKSRPAWMLHGMLRGESHCANNSARVRIRTTHAPGDATIYCADWGSLLRRRSSAVSQRPQSGRHSRNALGLMRELQSRSRCTCHSRGTCKVVSRCCSVSEHAQVPSCQSAFIRWALARIGLAPRAIFPPRHAGDGSRPALPSRRTVMAIPNGRGAWVLVL